MSFFIIDQDGPYDIPTTVQTCNINTIYIIYTKHYSGCKQRNEMSSNTALRFTANYRKYSTLTYSSDFTQVDDIIYTLLLVDI